jgi:hypothetical protein
MMAAAAAGEAREAAGTWYGCHMTAAAGDDRDVDNISWALGKPFFFLFFTDNIFYIHHTTTTTAPHDSGGRRRRGQSRESASTNHRQSFSAPLVPFPNTSSNFLSLFGGPGYAAPAHFDMTGIALPSVPYVYKKTFIPNQHLLTTSTMSSIRSSSSIQRSTCIPTIMDVTKYIIYSSYHVV